MPKVVATPLDIAHWPFYISYFLFGVPYFCLKLEVPKIGVLLSVTFTKPHPEKFSDGGSFFQPSFSFPKGVFR